MQFKVGPSSISNHLEMPYRILHVYDLLEVIIWAPGSYVNPYFLIQGEDLSNMRQFHGCELSNMVMYWPSLPPFKKFGDFFNSSTGHEP